MGIFIHNAELTSSVSSARLFKALILDADNLIPKVVPEIVQNVEILEGDGGPGTIKLFTFSEGSHFKSLKHRVDEIDKENHTYNCTIIDGDSLMDGLELISYVFKLEQSADGGSICKITSSYHTNGDAQIKEEDIEIGEKITYAMFKAVDAYLQANPDAYN